jgi:hypothetical protein
MFRNKLTKVLLVLSIAAMAVSAVRFEPANVLRVHVDVTRPLRLEQPMEIVRIGENGEHGLLIAPLVGRGWRNEAAGSAEYAFEVPADGSYYVWAYCLWHDACTNAVFVQLDGGRKTILGNDPIYGQWHWVRGPEVALTAGAHTIRLSNHSDNIAIRKVVLINSSTEQPGGSGQNFAELFYDGFDGCDNGNFDIWKKLSGDWSIRELPGSPGGRKVVVGRAADEALMTVGEAKWSNYQLDASVLPTRGPAGSSGGVCFGMESNSRYGILRWAEAADGRCRLIVERRQDDQVKTLGEFAVNWKAGIWHQLQVRLLPGRISIRLDGLRVGQIEAAEPVAGGIGLWLRNGDAEFDNIHVRSLPVDQ